ncbi:MAG: ArnT family glycosyltransferase [Candidatus Cyclobacteriaceae bacterium M2_1C_046]
MNKSFDRPNWIHITVITIISILSCWYTYENKVALLGDNANYYILGKALAQGDGFTLISHPNKPPNNHYPPGYPALVSVALKITGDSLQAVKIFNCLLFIGSVLLTYLLISRWINPVLGVVAAVFCALNSHMLFYSSIMMSEVPYLFFSLLTLYFFINIRSEFSIKDKYLYLTLLALVLTYYIRSLGVALLLGMLIHLLIQRKWKHSTFFVILFILMALPWSIRSSNLGGSSYMNQLKMVNPYQPALGEASTGDFIDRIGENLVRYVTKEIPSAFYPAFDPEYGKDAGAGDWLFGMVLIGFGIWGLWLIKQYRFLLLGYLLATFGILMLWPQVWYGVRFIVPIIPLFYIALGAVLAYLFYQRFKFNETGWKPYLLLLLALPLFSSVEKLHKEAYSPYHPAWENYFKAAVWAKNNLPKDAVISTGKPTLFYLYSDRPTDRYPFNENQEELMKQLKSTVDYVVIDQVYGNTIRYLLPVVQENRDQFEMVLHLKNPDTFLLKLKK